MGFKKKSAESISFKKSRFDFSHDVSTSFEFGECQPVLCRVCPTEHESHVIRLGSIVRLSPLQFPTFGRVMQRVTTHFVPFSHLFKNWKNFLSDIPTSVVSIVDGNYTESSVIPYGFPCINSNTLMKILLRSSYSTYRFVKRDGSGVESNHWTNIPTEDLSDSLLLQFFRDGGATSRYIGLSYMADFYTQASAVNSSVVNLLPESSDFQSFTHVLDGNYDAMLMVKLTTKGRRLLKVLYGLGYKPSFSSMLNCNLLPLLAYYKCWFDTYSINNYDNWETTNAYKLIKWIDDHGTIVLSDIGDESALVQIVLSFFLDLSETWYSEDSDYVSSALPIDGYLPSVTNKELDGFQYQKMSSSGYQTVNGSNEIEGYPSMENGAFIPMNNPLNSNTAKRLDHLSITLLKRMYISAMRDAVDGYAIEQRLRQRGYGSYVEGIKKYFLGSKSQMISISDVTATAETTDSPLAQVAGKGIGIIEKEVINFENDEPGYIISICTIYPLSRSVNALDPTLLGINKYTFYNPEFDALGFELTPIACIGHINGTEHGYNAGLPSDRNSFGLHPRYTGFKCSASNVLNGNFSTRSTLVPLLPYTLDRVVFENYFSSHDRAGDDQNPKFRSSDGGNQSLIPTAGKDWRFVANERWKGNYNRIFYGAPNEQNWFDTSGSINDVIPTSDNFLCNFEIVHTAWCSMKPIEESWNAESDEVMKHRSSDSVKQ